MTGCNKWLKCPISAAHNGRCMNTNLTEKTENKEIESLMINSSAQLFFYRSTASCLCFLCGELLPNFSMKPFPLLERYSEEVLEPSAAAVRQTKKRLGATTFEGLTQQIMQPVFWPNGSARPCLSCRGWLRRGLNRESARRWAGARAESSHPWATWERHLHSHRGSGGDEGWQGVAMGLWLTRRASFTACDSS